MSDSNEQPRWLTLSEDTYQDYGLTPYGVSYTCTKVAFDQEGVVFLKLSSHVEPEQMVLTMQEMQRFLTVYQEQVPLVAPDVKEAPL
ncbi:MAG: hypothetical protein JO202_14700 [Ktedonobacteraceae bacterium]|nr:hypothetical protein [Ktedonobacteraceae bacterium]